MTDKIDENFKKILKDKIPSGNLGVPEDVSNTVAFLASDISSYIHGETIHVNGGMYMSYNLNINLIRLNNYTKGLMSDEIKGKVKKL